MLRLSFLSTVAAASGDLAFGGDKKYKAPQGGHFTQALDAKEQAIVQKTFLVMEPVGEQTGENAQFQLRVLNLKANEITANPDSSVALRPVGQKPLNAAPSCYQVIETFGKDKKVDPQISTNVEMRAGWFGVTNPELLARISQHAGQYDQRSVLTIEPKDLNPDSKWRKNMMENGTLEQTVEKAMVAKNNPPAELPEQAVRLPRGVAPTNTFVANDKADKKRGGK